MARANPDPIPDESKSLEEAGAFWDTHSAADYWDQTEHVKAEIDLKERRFAILLDDKVYAAARQVAEKQHVAVDDLINRLLKKHLERWAG